MAPPDLPRVLEFDRAAFGADRGALLDRLYRTAPEYAFVAVSDGGIEGYSFGRHGFCTEHLGPVVAMNEDFARGLVSASLATNQGRASRSMRRNTAGVGWAGWSRWALWRSGRLSGCFAGAMPGRPCPVVSSPSRGRSSAEKS